ncbi:MAG: hypothetical protein D084_Lepto4C00013G0006 [Leptospirillum sp. Group IV 'UBA BS']|nr:MAG: hypothetical protein D084_Lepto4C00013G0006 [Leptospirillum sp. Group IV 'UBA BS']
MKRIFGLAIVALSLLPMAPAGVSSAEAASYKTGHSDPSGLYEIDPDHTSVTFTVGHAGVATAVGPIRQHQGPLQARPRKDRCSHRNRNKKHRHESSLARQGSERTGFF